MVRKAFRVMVCHFCFVALTGCAVEPEVQPEAPVEKKANMTSETQYATFGLGCFWCSEAVFEHLEGVTAVASGYEGGDVENPTYKQVCSGRTGHAEVIRVAFDPARISFRELLDVFWKAHDPTQLNRQGADVGTQYRSVIFTHSEEQKREAEASKKAISGSFRKPIATEISPSTGFYEAEDYHQDYFNNNPNQPYCRLVIVPKLKKLGMSTSPQ